MIELAFPGAHLPDEFGQIDARREMFPVRKQNTHTEIVILLQFVVGLRQLIEHFRREPVQFLCTIQTHKKNGSARFDGDSTVRMTFAHELPPSALGIDPPGPMRARSATLYPIASMKFTDRTQGTFLSASGGYATIRACM